MSEISEGLRLAAVGISVVFVALAVTALVISLVAKALKDKPPVPADKPTPVESLGGIDQHVLVLLAAAATAAVHRPVHIRRVRFVSHTHPSGTWAASGRIDHSDRL